MRTERPVPSQPDPPTRPVPTVLALLAFLPLAALVWWALAGPRPQPTQLEWSALGLEVRDAGAPPELPMVHDPEWLRAQMAGWQGDLGGQLDPPLPVGDSRYAAVVRRGDGSELATQAHLIGVVEWDAGTGQGGRCAFARPVPLSWIEAALDDDDPDVELEISSLAGRCADDGPLVSVTVVRRHVVPLSALQRLAGQRAESAIVPEGVLLVDVDGAVRRHTHLDADTALPAYPWEVARAAFLQAEPDNPAAEIGSWADPVYPLAVAIDGRLWWVLPVAPLDGAEVLTGYQLAPADEFQPGALNPIEQHWLAEPEPGPATIIDWTQDALRGVDDGDDAAIRPTLPSADGVWHGRVSTAADPLRYVIEASADGEACLVEPDGAEVACRQEGDVSRR